MNKMTMMMKFSISQLDRIIICLLNFAENKKFANNVKILFEMYDINSYSNDIEKETRVFLIKKLSDIIVDSDITDKNSILSLLQTDGKYNNEAIDIMNTLFNVSIKEQEATLLDSIISDQLRYYYLDSSADDIMDMLSNLKSENYDSLKDIVGDLSQSIDVLQKRLRDSKESIENSKYKVSLSDNSLRKIVSSIINEENNPSTKIKTGLRAFNDMIDGGFERSRVYVACAVAKGGKSMFLLNSCLWAKRLNNIKPKDPNKKPVIIYLTLENTNKETIKRIFNITFGDMYNFKDYTVDQAVDMLEQANVFTPNDETSPELIIEYRPNKSINTNDILGMLEDLEKEGKECVFLVVDYIKRLRSIKPNKELRLELSQITDELCVIARDKDIPILTATQLNRNAFRVIDEADGIDAKTAAFDRLGSADVGESIDIIQNSDVSFILNRLVDAKYDEAGEIEMVDQFMALKLIATRVKQPKYTSIRHPFKVGNSMALEEDINLPVVKSILDNDSFAKNRANGASRNMGVRQKIQ